MLINITTPTWLETLSLYIYTYTPIYLSLTHVGSFYNVGLPTHSPFSPTHPLTEIRRSRGALSRMSVEEKRDCLRATGVRPPRKRALSESQDQDRDLEDLMLPRMDEAVSEACWAIISYMG